MGVSEYSTTPGSNTTVNSIDIAEGCLPSTINNAIRQVMADTATMLLWPKKTSAYTAVAYDNITADTVTTAAFTITLPSSPTEGHRVTVGSASSWVSNNLTIGRGGSTIRGSASDLTLSDAGNVCYIFVYDGTTWQYYVVGSENFTAADRTKLDGIEASADVTDTANVDAAGATMNTDADVSSNLWVLDEDTMSSDSNTKVPTQQSAKAYSDTKSKHLVTSLNSGNDSYTVFNRLKLTSASGNNFHSSATSTGALEITGPAIGAAVFIDFEVSIASYNTTDEVSRIRVSGYWNNTTTKWANAQAYLVNGQNYDIRFGHDGSNNLKIWVGETSSTWSYPIATIHNFSFRFAGGAPTSSYIDDEWTLTWETTSFDTVQYTKTPGTNFGQLGEANTWTGTQQFSRGEFGDTDFHARLASSVNPFIQMDTGDYQLYTRSSDVWGWYIGSANYMNLTSSGLQVGNTGSRIASFGDLAGKSLSDTLTHSGTSFGFARDGTNGWTRADKGSSTNTGFLSFYDGSDTRQSYFGFASTSSGTFTHALENSVNNLVINIGGSTYSSLTASGLQLGNTGSRIASFGNSASLDEATVAEYRDDTASKVLTTDVVWDAADNVTLTYAASYTPDLDTFINGRLTMTGNITINNPTNMKVGQSGVIRLFHSGGARTVSFGSYWYFEGDTWTEGTSGQYDFIVYTVTASNHILCTYRTNGYNA